MKIASLIKELTVPCEDNGKRFTNRERLDRIETVMRKGNWHKPVNLALADLYFPEKFQPEKPFVLLSSHVDSVYSKFRSKQWTPELLIGTYDNSITNAVVAAQAVKGFEHQTVVAFTGSEERDSMGATQVFHYLTENGLGDAMRLAIVLDVTEEFYAEYAASIENVFSRSNRRKLLTRLTTLTNCFDLNGLIPDGAMDESYVYGELGFDVFSYCLPCLPLNHDIHDEAGIAVKLKAVETYGKLLPVMLGYLMNDELED